MRPFLAPLALVALLFAAPAHAQERTETLADIRQEMSVLYVEVQKLKRELSTTGASGQATVSGSVIDRVGAIEGELQRLTAKIEQLELRIDRIVTDGTRRIGDLEFRLVELEGGDLSKLGETSTLGGGALPGGGGGTIGGASVITPQTEVDQPEMAVGEKAAFDTAQAALDAGNHDEAAALFKAFRDDYPGGPLSDEAGLKRGEALEAGGKVSDAARVYLDLFSSAPTGTVAPEALFHLGAALGRLGQTNEACVTLGEVGARFPGSAAVAKAQSSMQNLGCQ